MRVIASFDVIIMLVGILCKCQFNMCHVMLWIRTGSLLTTHYFQVNYIDTLHCVTMHSSILYIIMRSLYGDLPICNAIVKHN